MDPNLPEGRDKWGRLPGRNYMRAGSSSHGKITGMELARLRLYLEANAHGQPIEERISRRECVTRFLCLCMSSAPCSVPLLPVIKGWERKTAETNSLKDRFGPFLQHLASWSATMPRNTKLIASGSMCGAHPGRRRLSDRSMDLVVCRETRTLLTLTIQSDFPQ
jgi:hypothetical protein